MRDMDTASVEELLDELQARSLAMICVNLISEDGQPNQMRMLARVSGNPFTVLGLSCEADKRARMNYRNCTGEMIP